MAKEIPTPIFAERLMRWAPYEHEADNRAYRKACGIRGGKWARVTILSYTESAWATRQAWGERNQDAPGAGDEDPGRPRGGLPRPTGELDQLWGDGAGTSADTRARQCSFCGKGVRGTPWLCFACESKLGAMCAAELCQALGLQRLEDAPTTPDALTKRGMAATPAELATGNLGFYQFRWWPDWIKALVSDERKRRKAWKDRRISPKRAAKLADAVATEQPASAEQALEDAEAAEAALQVAAELTPEEATVVKMREQDHKHAEIAETIGRSVRTSKRRLAAAREKLGEIDG